MSTAILVTGGTGTLGRKLVRKLVAAGRDVRVLSRKDRPGIDPATPKLPDWPDWFVGDLKTGIGVPKALDGVGIVVHCASIPGSDVEAAAQLLIAASRAGKPHILYPSMIGADKIEDDVYRDRRAVERLLAESELPWTVLRISHLHEHLDAALRRSARLPWVFVPAETDYQPIAANDVAERLFDLCTPMQAHQLPDLAGPEVIDAEDLTAFWLKSTHRRRKLVVLRRRGGLYVGYREGFHLAPDRAYGQQTFAEFVAQTYGPDVDKDGLRAKGVKAPKAEKPPKEKAPKPPKDPNAPKERRAWLGKSRDLDEIESGSADDATAT
ncbi:MAG TPA: NAD(P)H-binding protein [Sporichthya sp.]|nr:NAD(P)H-binding protein [Sporichthya sp.]